MLEGGVYCTVLLAKVVQGATWNGSAQYVTHDAVPHHRVQLLCSPESSLSSIMIMFCVGALCCSNLQTTSMPMGWKQPASAMAEQKHHCYMARPVHELVTKMEMASRLS
jgi:hypothetical protein